MFVGDGEQAASVARLVTTDGPVKDHHGIRSVRPRIPFLGVRQIQPFQRGHGGFFLTDQSLSFQSIPHLLIDLVNLRPALRDDHGGMIRLHQFQKTLCELLLLVGKGAGDDGILLVQPVKGLSQLPGLRFADRQPVLFQPLPFRLSFRLVGILAANAGQFGIFQPGVFFDGPECVGSFHGPMLVGVAGENHPALVFLHQPEQFQHLLAADLPGLVHHDHRAARQRTTSQKCADCLCADEPVPLQIHHLLALWGEDLNCLAASL